MQNKKHEELQAVLKPLIADSMKEFRKKRGWSQDNLAKKLKMSVRSYIDLEHKVNLSSTTTLIIFMSLMSEDERQVFIKDLLAAIQD